MVLSGHVWEVAEGHLDLVNVEEEIMNWFQLHGDGIGGCDEFGSDLCDTLALTNYVTKFIMLPDSSRSPLPCTRIYPPWYAGWRSCTESGCIPIKFVEIRLKIYIYVDKKEFMMLQLMSDLPWRSCRGLRTLRYPWMSSHTNEEALCIRHHILAPCTSQMHKPIPSCQSHQIWKLTRNSIVFTIE